MDIEDIFGDDGKKKPIKSGQKGKRNEREICDLLNDRFSDLLSNNKWGEFSRSLGSGNRWGQKVKLSKHAEDTFTGDIAAPENFKFVLESKAGYNTIDLCNAFKEGDRQIDLFLKQVSEDSDRLKKIGVDRKPLLLWKKDRRPRLAFLKLDLDYEYSMKYRDWTVVAFEELLLQPDTFFFNL
jgi:hypothetical protein